MTYRIHDDKKTELDLGLTGPDGTGLRLLFTQYGLRRTLTALTAALHDIE